MTVGLGTKALVTGGAGFIGSHVAEALVTLGAEVRVLDNFSSGSESNLAVLLRRHQVEVTRGDCRDPVACRDALSGVDSVFHFAGFAGVRPGLSGWKECFDGNIVATQVLLDEVVRSGASTMAFASSSTVYGDAAVVPTKEDYLPLEPISLYGATKLAAETMIETVSRSCGLKAVLLRLANVVGPRSRSGLVTDLIRNLSAYPRELKILGDGSQTKSYLHVDDCVAAVLASIESPAGGAQAFNVGSEDAANVFEVAAAVIEEMKINGVKVVADGGTDGGRGWEGDVKRMQLDIAKLKSKGWAPKHNSIGAVRLTVDADINRFAQPVNS